MVEVGQINGVHVADVNTRRAGADLSFVRDGWPVLVIAISRNRLDRA